jgi:hypothetical protein
MSGTRILRWFNAAAMRNLWIIVPIACMLVSCGKGQPQRTQDPAYFRLMAQGHDFEKDRKYDEAIQTYRTALSDLTGVYADLAVPAQIAVHNRLGACYRKKGDGVAALREFRISVGLGDRKFAPKAVVALEAKKKPSPQR